MFGMNFKLYRNGTGALHNEYISTHIRHDLTFLARPGIGSRKFSDEGGRSSVAAILDARQSLDEPHHESVSSSIMGVFPSINVTYGSNNEASRDFDTPLEIERSPQACSGHVCSRAAPSRAHTSGARLHSTDYHPPFLISECTLS